MQSLWMIAASLLFACMGVCVKLGAAQFAAAELVFWRGFIATLLIGSYVLLRRLPLATPHARTHLVRGVSGFVSLVMYFYAISMIPLAAAVTLNYTSPLFLALLLVLWVREPVRRGFYAVLAAVSSASSCCCSRRWPATSGWARCSASAPASSPASPTSTCAAWANWASRNGAPCSISRPWPRWAACPGCWRPAPSMPSTCAAGCCCSGVGGFGLLAQLCMTAAYKRGKTLVSASLAYSTVVFSSAFGMLLWGETLPWAGWAGVMMIVASGVVATALSGRTNTEAVTD
jgi:drug/metabolite transporter (DMT)-like permease